MIIKTQDGKHCINFEAGVTFIDLCENACENAIINWHNSLMANHDVVLGIYSNKEQAERVMDDMLNAHTSGLRVYNMPTNA